MKYHHFYFFLTNVVMVRIEFKDPILTRQEQFPGGEFGWGGTFAKY
jgi:hypothetical protein